MKKKLEADLISIAHRILKLKNKSELAQLHQETQKLYEKLSILKFVEDNFSDAKPTIGISNIEELILSAFENEEIIDEEQVVLASAETEIEGLSEEIEDEPILISEKEVAESEGIFSEEAKQPIDISDDKIDFEPHFEKFKQEKAKSKKSKKEAKQISFEDMLDTNSDLIFERLQSIKVSEESEVFPIAEIEVEVEEVSEREVESLFLPAFEMTAPEDPELIDEELEVKKSDFSKDTFPKTISFGLNDRIAFEKQLFGGSSEDLNRVISQLITFDTFDEAENFIEDMVKPDYNNWEGKDDYVARFMEIVEKKFV
ncbi:MAG: hypothetical protein EXR15_04500 [Chitinophagaceae bacterium]|nr:hypothetical protein [Chitinophagaceae bacterium]